MDRNLTEQFLRSSSRLYIVVWFPPQIPRPTWADPALQPPAPSPMPHRNIPKRQHRLPENRLYLHHHHRSNKNPLPVREALPLCLYFYITFMVILNSIIKSTEEKITCNSSSLGMFCHFSRVVLMSVQEYFQRTDCWRHNIYSGPGLWIWKKYTTVREQSDSSLENY